MNYDWRKSFQRLAELAGIEIKHGWIRSLSKKLGYNEGTLKGWTRRGAPNERLYQIEQKGYPPETWLVPRDGTESPLHEPTQAQAKRPHEDRGDIPAPNAGRYGAPDLSAHHVTQTYQPDEEWYIQAVREILRSGEHGTIIALQSNITQFREQVRDKAFLKAIQEQNKNLQAQNQELNERVAELERNAQYEKKGLQSRDPHTSNNSTETGDEQSSRSPQESKKRLQGVGNE